MRNFHPDVPLDEAEIVVVDVETTGLSPAAGDRVCEVGAVRLVGTTIVDSFGTLVNPQRPISPGAAAVNHITDAMVAEAPIFAAIAPALAGFMKESVIAGYNVPFDLSFLKTEFRAAGLTGIANPVIDALALSRQLLPGLPRYPQDSIASLVGIARPVRHRALEDAKTTATLLAFFIAIIRAHGCTTLGDLSRADLARVLHEKRLALIRHATTQKSDLWIRYLSSRAGSISERVITPVECLEPDPHRGDPAQLIAYCHAVGDQRTFRVDRILDLRLIHRLSP